MEPLEEICYLKVYLSPLWKSTVIRAFSTSFHRLRSDQSGAVAIMVAGMMLTLVVIGGAAIDFGRAYLVRQTLQSGIDSGALAAATSDSVNTTDLQNIAQDFIRANISIAPVTVNPATITVDPATRDITIDISAIMETSFIKLFGFRTLTISARTTVRQAAFVQLVLALDMSDSMKDFIPHVQAASNTLIDTVFTRSTSSRPVAAAVVPFAEYVNIGNASVYKSRTPSWLRIPATGLVNQCAQSCTTAPAGCTTIVDGVVRPCPPSCRSVPPCSWVVTDFYGCVSPRRVNMTSIVFNGTLADPVEGNRKACGGALLELSTSQTQVKSAIAGLRRAGTDTYLPAGLTWAWNVLELNEPLSPSLSAPVPNPYRRPYGGTNMPQTGWPRNVVVLLSDGGNSAVPHLDVYNTVGLPRVGTTDSVTFTDDDTRTICRNMRNAGIEIFTVLYNTTFAGGAAPSASAQAVMQDCATSGQVIIARNAAGLTTAFTTIANMISDVRLIR